MTAAPQPEAPRPGIRRRTGRGFVDSFGNGRICSSAGCRTQLSQYNPESVCSSHEPPRRS